MIDVLRLAEDGSYQVIGAFLDLRMLYGLKVGDEFALPIEPAMPTAKAPRSAIAPARPHGEVRVRMVAHEEGGKTGPALLLLTEPDGMWNSPIWMRAG